jgi:hypothetical protein
MRSPRSAEASRAQRLDHIQININRLLQELTAAKSERDVLTTALNKSVHVTELANVQGEQWNAQSRGSSDALQATKQSPANAIDQPALRDEEINRLQTELDEGTQTPNSDSTTGSSSSPKVPQQPIRNLKCQAEQLHDRLNNKKT